MELFCWSPIIIVALFIIFPIISDQMEKQRKAQKVRENEQKWERIRQEEQRKSRFVQSQQEQLNNRNQQWFSYKLKSGWDFILCGTYSKDTHNFRHVENYSDGSIGIYFYIVTRDTKFNNLTNINIVLKLIKVTEKSKGFKLVFFDKKLIGEIETARYAAYSPRFLDFEMSDTDVLLIHNESTEIRELTQKLLPPESIGTTYVAKAKIIKKIESVIVDDQIQNTFQCRINTIGVPRYLTSRTHQISRSISEALDATTFQTFIPVKKVKL